MQIDAFTLIAEIFNFLLLVFLLQRFLYRPIIRVMDAREKETVDRLKEAEEKREEAARERRRYQDKVQEIEQQRDRMLDEARQESRQQREQMIDEIRDEVESMRRSWREAVSFEREAFLRDLRQEVGEEIVKTARMVLADMANRDLENHVVRVFVERLGEIDEGEREKLAAAAAADDQPLQVQTAFELSDEARKLLEGALQPFAQGQKLHFDVNDRLLCGVRVASADYEIAWSFDHYIGALQDRFQKSLEENLREIADERAEQPAE
jgi:F-type H+-transporting ATPase subunit b